MVSGLQAARHVNDTLIWCSIPRKHFHSNQTGSLLAHFTGKANCRIRQNEECRVFKVCDIWHQLWVAGGWRAIAMILYYMSWEELSALVECRVPTQLRLGVSPEAGSASKFSLHFSQYRRDRKIKRQLLQEYANRFGDHLRHNKARFFFSDCRRPVSVLLHSIILMHFYLHQWFLCSHIVQFECGISIYSTVYMKGLVLTYL